MKILIVDDDANIAELIELYLTKECFQCMQAHDGEEALKKNASFQPDLILLDIMLPGLDGLTILKMVKNDPALRRAGVIMVTAKSTELDAVVGLDHGADDYIAKPFGIMELISRVKALTRRLANDRPQALTIDELTLDDERHIVTSNGKECLLTFKEYELLKYLMLNRGIVLSRDRLMDVVWGTDYEGGSRTVDMHVKTLRQKLGDSGAHIKTVRSVGYKIE